VANDTDNLRSGQNFDRPRGTGARMVELAVTGRACAGFCRVRRIRL